MFTSDYYERQREWTVRDIEDAHLDSPASIATEWMIKRFERLEETVIARFLSKHVNIVDVGCRTGFIKQYLLMRGYRNVVAFDISFKAIQLSWGMWAHSNFVADMHHIPLPGYCADCVLLREVLEHSPKPKILLEEIWRILRHGGFCYIEVPLEIEGEFMHHDGSHEVFFRTDEEVLDLIESIGFKAHLNGVVKAVNQGEVVRMMIAVTGFKP